MKKTLIVHMGYHKTGSSSIQYNIKHFYKELIKKTNTKIVFEESFFAKDEINHGHLVKNIVSTKSVKKKMTIINEIIDYVLNSEQEKFIFSAENFSFFEYFKNDLKLFDKTIKNKNINIRYILFIRKRNNLFLSLAKQLKIKNYYYFYFLLKFKKYYFKDKYSPYTINFKSFIKNFSSVTNCELEVFFYDMIDDVTKYFFYYILGYKEKIFPKKRNKSYNLFPRNFEKIINKLENKFF